MASLSASNHVARVLSVANHLADVDAESRIAMSWRRCLISHKLDPARQGPPQTFTEAEVRHVAEPMPLLLQKRDQKDGTVRYCQNEDCDYKITVDNAEVKSADEAEDAVSA